MIEVSLDPWGPHAGAQHQMAQLCGGRPHYRLEYRVQLRGEVSQFGLWDLVAWKEAAADPAARFHSDSGQSDAARQV